MADRRLQIVKIWDCNSLVHWKSGHWILFGFWDLDIGILIMDKSAGRS